MIIQQCFLVNEGKIEKKDVLIEHGKIAKIDDSIALAGVQTIDATGKYLLPGIIDGQVHFRDPGLTHKADISSESKAAVAGGVTSFIDMPNTVPNVLSLEILEEKYAIAAQKSLANYAFLLGVNGENLDYVCGIDTSKLLAVTDDGLYFTKKGNLLADNPETLERLFSGCDAIIAIHSEKEAIIEANEEVFRAKYGENVPVSCHPLIRNEQACYEATEQAI
jgi:dihydroorotase